MTCTYFGRSYRIQANVTVLLSYVGPRSWALAMAVSQEARAASCRARNVGEGNLLAILARQRLRNHMEKS